VVLCSYPVQNLEPEYWHLLIIGFQHQSLIRLLWLNNQTKVWKQRQARHLPPLRGQHVGKSAQLWGVPDMWQNLFSKFQKTSLIDNKHMTSLEACYALMVQYIVTLIRVFATHVQKVLWGVYVHSSCGKLLSALAACAVAQLATGFVYLKVSIS